jgi:putative acetyltransferase
MFDIRRAVQADSPAIHDVHLSSIRGICAAVYTPEQVHDWTVNKKADGYVVAIGTHDFFVAEQHGRVVGFSEFAAPDREIRALYVHPDFVGKGVGHALLCRAEEAARSARIASVRLHSTVNAVSFYEAHGYGVERLDSQRLGTGTLLPCVLMQKSLAPQATG